MADRSRTRAATLLMGASLLASSLAGCGAGSGERAGVFASTTVIADLVRLATCGEVRATSLVPPGADAHDLEVDARTADELRSAALVVTVGLGYEAAFADALDRARDAGAPVVEVGPTMRPIAARAADEHADDEHTDEHADEGEAGLDPHVWMDPTRMADAVTVVAESIEEAGGFGLSDDRLRSCAEAGRAELATLDADLAARIAPLPAERRVLVTNHDTLGYFADRYDFEVVGTVIPSTTTLSEPDLQSLDELATTLRERQVPAIFTDAASSDAVARRLADRVGRDVAIGPIAVESLDPDAGIDTYPALMRTDAERIVGALAG